MVGPLFGIRPNLQFLLMAQCLKITEKVSFNNASEASYVQTVLPDKTLLMVQKLLENTKNTKIQMRHCE